MFIVLTIFFIYNEIKSILNNIIGFIESVLGSLLLKVLISLKFAIKSEKNMQCLNYIPVFIRRYPASS